MRFFDNSAINRIYLHSGLHGLSEHVGGIFVFIFLLKAGITAHLVLLSLAALVLMRLGFRQLVLPFAARFGLRGALIFGIVVGALGYIPLGFISGISPALGLYIFLTAFGDAFYWASYHANSARFGDEDARGAQVSAVQLVYSLSNIIGPLFGGFALVYFGPVAAFLFAGTIRLIGALPLLATPNIPVNRNGSIDNKSYWFATSVYFFDGFGAAASGITWSLALFITLGENFQSYGLALAGAAIFGALMALGIGRLFDLGHHKWSTAIGMCAVCVFVFSAAIGYHNPVSAAVTLCIGAIAGPLYASVYNARVYNLAKASGEPLRFHVAGEGGWDIGCALGCCIAAFLIWQGLSFTWPMATGLLGTAGVWFTLHRSYQ